MDTPFEAILEFPPESMRKRGRVIGAIAISITALVFVGLIAIAIPTFRSVNSNRNGLAATNCACNNRGVPQNKFAALSLDTNSSITAEAIYQRDGEKLPALETLVAALKMQTSFATFVTGPISATAGSAVSVLESSTGSVVYFASRDASTGCFAIANNVSGQPIGTLSHGVSYAALTTPPGQCSPTLFDSPHGVAWVSGPSGLPDIP
jgi:hypothetical protein